MKKMLSLLPLLMMAVLLVSCSEDEKETCDQLGYGDKPEECKNAEITVCTADETYFIFNGVRYDKIDSDNPDDNTLVKACAPNASAQRVMQISLELDAVTLQFVNEARTAALCQQ